MAMFDLRSDRYGDAGAGASSFNALFPETPQAKDTTDPLHGSNTGFWTDSPGPLYDNFGNRNSTPQPSQADIYNNYRTANPTPGSNFDGLLNSFGSYGYNASPYMYGNTPSGNELSINGQKTKVTTGDIGQPGTSWYNWGSNDAGGNGGGGNAGGPGGYSGGSIFDDPATRDFMALLNQRVNSLNTPYTPPDLSPLTDYLKSYFQKLQGPAYTPQQMDLLQTQSLDPLSRERDAVHQRVLESASRRGLDPKSGIVQKQLSDADNQFEQIRTRTQAGFASKAVDLDRINAQQAASVGQLLANIEQSNQSYNEGRQGQALQTAQIVPDLARQRFQDANGLLAQNSLNPTSLLSLSQNANQFDSQQTQNYLLGIGQLLPAILKLFGGGK